MFVIYTNKEKLKFCSELIILGGLVNQIEENNKLRMNGLIEFCKKNIKYTNNIEEANIIVLPYKLNNTNDILLQNYIDLSNKYNKPLLTFYIDDNNQKFNLPDNCIIYRTAFSTLDKRINERAIMPLIDDVYNNILLENTELSIGFCGQINCNRKFYLNYLLKCGLNTNFLLRPITYFSGNFKGDKNKCRKEYFNNIESNIFTFCYRGYGNYSYRFFEVLMMGRIPILVNTDCVIPFFNEAINDGLSLVIVDEKDFLQNNELLKNSILDFYNKNQNNLLELQKTNRKIYENYYSYYGFINNIIKIYK